MAEPGPAFAGPLLRQNNIMKNWHRYNYALQGNYLIERAPDTRKETARFRITPTAKIERAKKSSRPFSFIISTHLMGRPITFAAPNEASLNEWIAKLTEAKAIVPKQDPEKRVSIADFEILRVLGRGTYGKVSLVRHKESGQLFAMKAMSKALLDEDGNIEQILTEKNILMENHHPFLVSAHFSFQTETKVFIVCDYVPGGELFTRLRQEVRFSEERTRYIAAEIVEALGYMHSQSLIYRDLKPENVLFDEDGHVKLTDFGYAKKLKSPDGTAASFCGTPDYVAPEMLMEGTYTKSIDWWSLGCVIYEMLVGISPFYNKNVQQMYEAIENEPVKFPEIVSDTAMDLIDKLLAKDPGMRLGNGPNDAEEIKCHRFFKGIDWQAVYERKIEPLWRPAIRSETDTSMFDDEFTREPAVVSYESPVSLATDSERLLEGFSYTNDGSGGEATCIPDDDDL